MTPEEEKFIENLQKGVQNTIRLNQMLVEEVKVLKEKLASYEAQDVIDAWREMNVTEEEARTVTTMLRNIIINR